MKISKVDHTRTGVGIQGTRIQGMLYQNPKKNGTPEPSIESRVKELTRRSQSLYQLLGEKGKEDKNQRNLCRKIRTCVNELTRALLREYEEGDQADIAVEKQLEYLNHLPEKKIFDRNRQTVDQLSFEWRVDNTVLDPKTVVDTLVYGSLRKSMKRTVRDSDGGNMVLLPEVISQLILALCSGPKYREVYLKIAEKEIYVFLKALNTDYHKDKLNETVPKSIRRQNVHVQAVKEGDNVSLQLASAANSKKEYVFEFLKEYATSDPENKKNMLIHFRQLVLLYYCGHEIYVRSGEGDLLEWSFGELLPDISKTFSEEALDALNQSLQCEKHDIEYRRLCIEVKERIRYANTGCYLRSVAEPGLTEADQFWLLFIERQTENLLIERRNWDMMVLSQAYLCQKVFTEWISYIGMKYVEMGKAVFHFAMPKGEDILTADSFGEVLPEYQNGITSFDYERVKAEEALEQRVSAAISFAVDNFDRSVRDDNARCVRNREDILQLLNSQRQLDVRPDAYTRLMQFFGGKSKWSDSYIELYEDQQEVKTLITAVGKTLNRIRNATFHYTGQWTQKLTDTETRAQEIIHEMFDWEYDRVGSLIRKKYYTNNTLMFYPATKIEPMIRQLYEKPAPRPSQIPAFGRILNKASLKEFGFVKGDKEKKLYSRPLAVMEQFRNSLLFILKEIYYYDFLQADDLKSRFLTELLKQNENDKATDNLVKRIKKLDPVNALSFGELCQAIMTDYNLQNTQMKRAANENNKGRERQNYKHFRTLLYVGIRKTFRAFLSEQEEKYGFLRSPAWTEGWAEQVSEQDFCFEGEPLSVYAPVKKDMELYPDLLDWYATAHFLNQRKLNELIGSIKNYLTFIHDINVRAGMTGNRENSPYVEEQEKYYEKVLAVLDFSKLFCEQLSNQLTDYFVNENDYEDYLLNYVDWKGSGSLSLLEFSRERVSLKDSPHAKIGIYYDDQNPIINRNIIRSRMYGNERLLSTCFTSVKRTEIIQLYKDEKELTNRKIFQNGICSNEKDQELLRHYQNLKNRIELVDLEYGSEMVNDLMNQLRVWCYMRERDMMYFQMGYHYIALQYGNKENMAPWLNTLDRNEKPIVKGAILYQIVAMYTYRLPLYRQDGSDSRVNSAGQKVTAFINDYCGRNEDIYKDGLCLFEKLGKNDEEHTRLVKIRNHIDHFHYEVTQEKSIMELYREMFESFLRYDPKLRKSVPVMLQNILLDYFVIVELNFSNHLAIAAERTDGKKKPPVRSDLLTFKLYSTSGGRTKAMGQEVKVPARSEQFVKTVRMLLEYKKE